MSQCHTPLKNAVSQPKKYRCPENGKQYSSVSSTTMLHHIDKPWQLNMKQQGYYFCTDAECDVVYFGEDDSVINKTSLRTSVGLKEKADDALVCYCFGVSRKSASDQKIKDFVIKNTKEQTCACFTRNPSGKCCLTDFPK